MERIASIPCLVCGARSTVHHVTAGIHGGRVSRRHDRTVPLCPRHHQIQHGPRESVEALGHGGFYREYGIDLMDEAERLWIESSRRYAA
ncbi:hypothetical protein [Aurantiacibacter spongiae]|nr:hypothetical protein [Aurantiacibacter spongiae]